MFHGLDITLLDIEEGFEECFLTSDLPDYPYAQRAYPTHLIIKNEIEQQASLEMRGHD